MSKARKLLWAILETAVTVVDGLIARLLRIP